MASSKKKSMAFEFPLDALLRIRLLHFDEPLRGRVYCTDEISQTLVLIHKTNNNNNNNNNHGPGDIFCVSRHAILDYQVLERSQPQPQQQPPHVQRKALEQQEKRALRLAQDALKHIHPNASPEGQAVFDRLLKACNEVEWCQDGETILVMNQIKVFPPYGVENCQWAEEQPPKQKRNTTKNEGSLERVKRIVAHSNHHV